MSNARCGFAFTLVELLVTIAVIAVMMGWILSALQQSREQARLVGCLPANDLWSYTNDPRAWWHPEGFRRRKTNICFVDGHAEYQSVQILVKNTDTYRRDP